MTEIYKTKSDLNSPFMNDLFMERNISYNPRHGNDAQRPKVRTMSFTIVTIAYLGNKTWQLIPTEKRVKHPSYFQKRIRCWNSDKCNYATGGSAKDIFFIFLDSQQDRHLIGLLMDG